jgi:hypothetical protein
MSQALGIIIIFAIVALIALAVLWWWATRMKQDLDGQANAVAGVRGEIELPASHAKELRRLSGEPILLKQSEEGVRVQIEHRPMMPLMAFVGKEASAALAAAAAEISERYGVRWAALVTSGDDGRITIQRLS